MRRLPVLATLVVLLAAATMVALGVWQLQRMAWKEDLLARYQAAAGNDALAAFPVAGTGEGLLFRRSTIDCARVLAIEPRAGRSARGESGWAQRATCANGASDAALTVDIGWTRTPQPVTWRGGTVTGVIAPGPRLVATGRVSPDLEPLAAPDPNDIPNNHFAYAMQWFFFAATALAIYALALRKKLRGQALK